MHDWRAKRREFQPPNCHWSRPRTPLGPKADRPEAVRYPLTRTTTTFAPAKAVCRRRGGGGGGAGLKEKRTKRKRFVTPTETNVHRNALRFVVMGASLLHNVAVGGWQLAVSGCRWATVGPFVPPSPPPSLPPSLPPSRPPSLPPPPPPSLPPSRPPSLSPPSLLLFIPPSISCTVSNWWARTAEAVLTVAGSPALHEKPGKGPWV